MALGIGRSCEYMEKLLYLQKYLKYRDLEIGKNGVLGYRGRSDVSLSVLC